MAEMGAQVVGIALDGDAASVRRARVRGEIVLRESTHRTT